MADRAVVFIDGNNWYHALCHVNVEDRARLDYRKISEKLLGPREWVATRYYIGQVNQKFNAPLYAQQRSFLASLESTDPRSRFTSAESSHARSPTKPRKSCVNTSAN